MKKVKNNFRVVFITCANFEEGEKIVNEIVKAKLAACGNIFSGLTSIYWWKGNIEKAEEVLVILKTKKSKVKKITKKVKQLHSYEVFELISLPILEGNNDYLKWIEKNINNKT